MWKCDWNSQCKGHHSLPGSLLIPATLGPEYGLQLKRANGLTAFCSDLFTEQALVRFFNYIIEVMLGKKVKINYYG